LVQLAPWDKSSDREIKIRGRHSRAFYGHADRLLRDEVQFARVSDADPQNSDLLDGLRRSIAATRQALLTTQHEVEA
jgi:hypothetical protein